MIWFDLDDTLTDFRWSSLIALGAIYREHSLARYFADDEQRWLDIYHRHNAALWERFNREEITGDFLRPERFRLTLAEAAGEAGFPAELPGLLADGYLHHLAEATTPIPGAREALQAVHSAGMRTGVLTNGFAGVQERKLEVAGLTNLIDCVIVSDRVGANKPSPRIFEIAAATAHSHLNALVGDNPATDIAGAAAAGWHAVLFRPDGPPDGFTSACATTLPQAAAMAMESIISDPS